MQIRSAACSHPGQRIHQEDTFLVEEALGLFAIADGMGAQVSGRPAADLALAALLSHYRHASGVPAEERLKGGLLAANAAIFAKTSAAAQAWELQKQGLAEGDPQLGFWMGRGSTLVALGLSRDGRQASIAHVGDSRAYRLRDGELGQLTTDHRLIEEARREGMPESEIAKMPTGVIVQALGMRDTVRVDSQTVPVADGDLFLLASDGLADAIGTGEIAAVLRRHAGGDLAEAAAKLVDRAVSQKESPARGDNVTVVVLRVAAAGDKSRQS